MTSCKECMNYDVCSTISVNCDRGSNRVMYKDRTRIGEIKHGKWEYAGTAVGVEYNCSECGNYIFTDKKTDDLYPYCPYCGAKMELDKN